jgi:hypothetical protein
MMSWFSNHLLVEPAADGSFDDQGLKSALRAGRLYAAFEVLGYPSGFDFVAVQGSETLDMGSEVSLAGSPELRVRRPRLRGVEPESEPPLTLRLLRAREAGWDIVAEGDGDLAVSVDAPGAYRAEVRMVPVHLEPHLASYAALAQNEYVWIYSNAIYVVE